jgi:hypothetical protein
MFTRGAAAKPGMLKRRKLITCLIQPNSGSGIASLAAACYVGASNNEPITAVAAMARAPQKVTRSAPTATRAPPV